MFQTKYANSNISPSSTDASLVTAKPGVSMRVIGGFLVASATATSIVFNSKGTGAGTAISSTIYCGANGGLIMPSPSPTNVGEPPPGYFQTIKSEGLSATTGSGTTVGVTVVYVEVT
jgi:hypothetical protein